MTVIEIKIVMAMFLSYFVKIMCVKIYAHILGRYLHFISCISLSCNVTSVETEFAAKCYELSYLNYETLKD